MIPLPVAGLVPLLSTGSITIRRRGQPTINEYGESVPAPYVDMSVEAVVHPADAAVLQQLPEANLIAEHVEVYTTQAIRTAQGSNVPDEILWSGAWYKVISVSDYEVQGGVFYAVAERMTP